MASQNDKAHLFEYSTKEAFWNYKGQRKFEHKPNTSLLSNRCNII